MQEQIVIIFVIGHAVSILLTPFANYAADLYGKVYQINFNFQKVQIIILMY
jgi:hypothetical protein